MPGRERLDPRSFFGFFSGGAPFLYSAERFLGAEVAGVRERRDGRVAGFEFLGELFHFRYSFVKEIVPSAAFDVDAAGNEVLVAGKADRFDVASTELGEQETVDFVGHAGGVDQELWFFRALAIELLTLLFTALVIDEEGLTIPEAIDAIQAETKAEAAEIEVAFLFDSFDGERLFAPFFNFEPVENDFFEALDFDGSDDFAKRTRAAVADGGGGWLRRRVFRGRRGWWKEGDRAFGVSAKRTRGPGGGCRRARGYRVRGSLLRGSAPVNDTRQRHEKDRATVT